ncbi:MAG: hypothetical protein ACR2PR_10770 [Pseudohongiellaceae bacterium]
MSNLVKCRDCENEVSPRAKVCPHCGLKKPQPLPPQPKVSEVIGGLVVLVVLGLFVWWAIIPTEEEREEAEAERVATRTPCEKDWRDCVTVSQFKRENNLWFEYVARCKRTAESQAKYGDVDWGGWFTPNFDYYGTSSDIQSGVITLIDNVAQYQNVFGGRVKAQTDCTVNLNTGSLVDIKIGGY